ncbi:MAG: tetratricopeptide repeat protein [Bacteroidales bacterium]|nr:tetratricopeptide repeat protein [Bacteroidales bacterium]
MRRLFLYRLLIIACFVLYQSNISAQSIIDSLSIKLSKTKGEEKIQTLNALAKETYKTNIDESLSFAKQALELSKKSRFKKGEGDALHHIGNYYKRMGLNDSAIIFYKNSLEIREQIGDTVEVGRSHNNLGSIYFALSDYQNALVHYEKAYKNKVLLGDKKGQGISLNSIGNVYFRWGKFEQAIEIQQKALKLFEEINFKPGIAGCLLTLGAITENISENLTENLAEANNIENFRTALDYYEQALKIQKEINDLQNMASTYGNMGNIYSRVKEYKKAIEYYNEEKSLREKINDLQGLAGCLNNIGTTYGYIQDHKKASEYFVKAMEINEKLDDKYGLAHILAALATSKMELKEYTEAISLLKRSLVISREINIVNLIKINLRKISETYEKSGMFDKALKTYIEYTMVKDSLLNEETHKQIADMQTKYETDKKELELKNRESIIEKQQEINKQQERQLIFAIIGSIVVLIVLVLMIIQYIQKRRANIELAAKNDLITHQKQEIMDSILYARRIQTAILPPGDYVQKILPERLIFFKPRDIVSGDFYWIKHIEHADVIIATAADCTGHGVPGAFMSMLGVAFLNEIVSRPNISHPDEVLNHLRDNVITSLHQTGRFGEAQDGMDIALIAYYPQELRVEFAGANNPLYIIRQTNNLECNGALIEPALLHNELYLFEIKGDKMPIGIHTRVEEPFTNKNIKLEKGDLMYIFSDGYADQFGGPDAKKFKYKPFKQLLMENCHKPMDEQRDILDDFIIKWQGELSQVDDIIILGIRV